MSNIPLIVGGEINTMRIISTLSAGNVLLTYGLMTVIEPIETSLDFVCVRIVPLESKNPTTILLGEGEGARNATVPTSKVRVRSSLECYGVVDY